MPLSVPSPGARFEDTELERLKLVDSIKTYKSKAVSWELSLGTGLGWEGRSVRPAAQLTGAQRSRPGNRPSLRSTPRPGHLPAP